MLSNLYDEITPPGFSYEGVQSATPVALSLFVALLIVLLTI